MSIFSYLSILIFLFNSYFLSKSLKRYYPVLEIILLIAGMQWIVFPFIEYSFPYNHYKYYMYVDEVEYFSIVFPFYLFFSISLLYFKTEIRFEKNVYTTFITKRKNLGINILIFSLISSVLENFSPSSFSFIFYLLKLLIIPGFLISWSQGVKRYLLLFIYAIFFVESLFSGMFHDLILITLSLALGIAIQTTLKLKHYFGAIIFIFFIFFLQNIKSDIRTISWDADIEKNIGSYIDILDWSQVDELIAFNGLNPRFNQGWIISKIFQNKRDNYINSENTIYSSISSILLPRFLFPNKRTVESNIYIILSVAYCPKI